MARGLLIWLPEGPGGVRATSRALTGQLARALPWLLILLTAVFIGWVVSGEADVWIGHQSALLALALLAAASVSSIFASLGSTALVAWPPLAVAGYLLVRFPRDHPVITFDRVWIGGLLAYILLADRRIQAAASSRFMKIGLGVFIAEFGIRAISTSTSISGPIQTWINSIVLPSIVFVAASRYATTRERTQRFAASLMIAGGLLGAIGLAERLVGFELASLSGGERRYDEVIGATRISGPYSVPETYALSLVICFAATLYWLQSRGRGPYIWGILIAGLEVTGIAFSYFRAAWIAALLVVIGSFGIRPRRFGRTVAVAVIVGSLAFAGTAQLVHCRSCRAGVARVRATDTSRRWDLARDSPATCGRVHKRRRGARRVDRRSGGWLPHHVPDSDDAALRALQRVLRCLPRGGRWSPGRSFGGNRPGSRRMKRFGPHD